ncbi:Type 1 glutamine amidotransferase-like domain-containing protein [Candidatus Nomurabacteria bacterium]|nr:Type 1 glutamine amidotransferase-like domain-containing protein [Candidatus Nomurabacteria bacterium]
MTKYILHGGATSKDSPDNKKFFNEAMSSLPDQAVILFVYFAREKELWPKMLEQDKLHFSPTDKQKVFNFTIADDKISNLIEQIKKADLIYLRGGQTDRLKDTLSKVKNLGGLLKDKVVVGSSAGAYVLSRYYYTNSKDIILNGLDILPIKTFCHYSEEKADKLDKLKQYEENLKVYAIPEEKFFIIEV